MSFRMKSIGKLSIVGVGMRSQPGVAAKLFETLAHEGVNIDMISRAKSRFRRDRAREGRSRDARGT